MGRAVIYTRVSTKAQEDGYSLGTQEQDCRAWCERHKHEVVAVQSDTFTGYDSLKKRAGMQQALRMLIRREADVLVIWMIDRAGRFNNDNQQLLQVVSKAGGTLASVNDGIIENTAEGRLMLSVKSYKGEGEYEVIKMRTERGIAARVAAKRILASAVPLYGYTWQDGKEEDGRVVKKASYQIVPEAADVVRWMYQRATEGWAVRRICKDLNERGVPSPSKFLALRHELPRGRIVGETWERSTAYNVLTNESYTGKHQVRRRESYKETVWDEESLTSDDIKRRRMRSVDDPKRVALNIPGIVDREQWELVQGKIKARALSTTGEVDGALLNRGIAYCGVCGSRMIALWHHASQQRIYMCGNRTGQPVAKEETCRGRAFAIRAKIVDPAVWNFVKEIIRDQPRWERMVKTKSAQYAEQHQEALREVETIESMLADRKATHARVDRRRHAQEDDYLAALDGQELKRLAGEIAELETRLKAIHGAVNSVERQLQAHQRLVERVKQNVERYRQDAAQQAQMRESLAQIGVDPSRHLELVENLPSVIEGASLDQLSREQKRDIMRDLGLVVDLYPRGWVDAEGKKHERIEPRLPEEVSLSSTPECG